MSYRQIPSKLQHREEFTGNTLRAEYHEPGRDLDVGRLPFEWYDSVVHASYIVFSYRTPIGWAFPDGTVVVPDVKYSVTTSRGQNVVRGYLR